MTTTEPIHQLPESYTEAAHLSFADPRTLLRLNLYSIALIVPFLALMIVWGGIVRALRGPLPGGEDWPSLLLWLAVILVLPLHEWIHGVAIRSAGHTPRYGTKSTPIGAGFKIPYALFATADNALFRRAEFIRVALAPVVTITVAALALMLVLPDGLVYYLTVAVILNGAGSIGDFWMTACALRYPPDALIRDEEDSMRVYIRSSA